MDCRSFTQSRADRHHPCDLGLSSARWRAVPTRILNTCGSLTAAGLAGGIDAVVGVVNLQGDAVKYASDYLSVMFALLIPQVLESAGIALTSWAWGRFGLRERAVRDDFLRHGRLRERVA